MARDIDFKYKPKPSQHQSKPISQPPNEGDEKFLWRFAVWLMAIGVVVIIGAFYWQFSSTKKPVTANKHFDATPLNQTASSGQGTPATTEISAQTTTTSVRVNLYNSGAGEETVVTLSDTLKEQGYQVKILGNSQFDYDKTYIWYRAGSDSDAEALQKILTNRTVTLRETKIEGDFDILIYLGKN